ncbi:unnamed protein product [Fusarium graminearum]|uniref:Chromosome 4, complete genome n=1 Tax=Gibberella zeae (strain ATCC MYA-4620 / CBS 123657 / FGSC 9075 / NRRL 31084 / PH-1) TaxID=229533 RepID=A0A098DPP7_GIBZE|nr:unnamed protein product [Fusarium graminearum]CZS72738.1 unnamed protein product [Fusarium graminearum]
MWNYYDVLSRRLLSTAYYARHLQADAINAYQAQYMSPLNNECSYGTHSHEITDTSVMVYCSTGDVRVGNRICTLGPVSIRSHEMLSSMT